MTAQATPGLAVMFPDWLGLLYNGANGTVATHSTSLSTLDLTGEKSAAIGIVRIVGGGSKTFSGGTPSAISWLPGSPITFADGSTTMDVGIQGVATTGGSGSHPDGTYIAKGTLTGSGSPSIVASTWNTVVMTSGAGATVTDGDLISIVWDMTGRAGSDSVLIENYRTSGSALPFVNTHNATIWSTTASKGAGCALITFSDSSIGYIEYTAPAVSTGVTSMTSSGTNEYGVIINVPWACTVNTLFARIQLQTASTSDCKVHLYSDPLGATPVQEQTYTIDFDAYNQATANQILYRLPIPATNLTANTDYAVVVEGTSTGVIYIPQMVLADAAIRAVLPCGTNYAKVSRSGGSGAFSEEGAGTTMYYMGVGISKFDDGAGGGGGLLTHAGMSGGMRG